ncbi:Uncharacterised protein [Clostridium putrefaciens]|uniref:Uncharacterized protein n=1 Tax=Clostridium putrefaciens TaxID=99675 RepID=A0A381JAX2_9CLOT|nr:hypothetical protein [Clostridium putrefaciens]SUY48149.1 Uncharacterised protein [Clostridium putrefaciens]
MEWVNNPQKITGGSTIESSCWIDICTLCFMHGCKDHFGCKSHGMNM